jgi:hypothetical protein
MFFEITKRSGFQKSKDKINAKYDAELAALEGNKSTTNDEYKLDYLINKTPIKAGVEELFESNPELANSVYEALGFKSEKTIETAKGSTYRYLPSGKTQRFKKVEGKEYEPQDILTFVPNYEWIKSNNPQWLEKQGLENDTQYTQYYKEKIKFG